MSTSSAVTLVWRHRALLSALVVRDIQNRYAGSLAGIVWALAHPLIMLGIYGFVFEYVFHVRVPTLSANQPYIAFVAVALWPWLAFQEAVMRGTQAVQNHAVLIKKVAFPHELLVYSCVLSSFAVQMAGFLTVLIALRLLGCDVYFSAWPVVLLCILSLLVVASAVALLLGALQVFVRDVEQLLPQLLSILFYATPILYALSSLPPAMANVMQWSPLVHMLETVRNALLQTGEISWPTVGLMVLGSAAVFYPARHFFLKLSPHFEDMV